MKKLFKKGLVLISFAVAFAFGTASYAADTVMGSLVQEYNGKTYTSIKSLCNGMIKDGSVSELPYSILASNIEEQRQESCIYEFAIYFDRIYYLKGVPGSDNVIGSICSCNMDGSDIRLIANDADALGDFFISDGCLYYDVLYDYDNSHGRNLNGGIMKINLNTGAYAKIVTDISGWIANILDDNIFYWVDGNCHLMKTDGRYVGGISPYDIEISTVISGATGYYGDIGSVFARDWNGNINWICNVPRFVDGYGVYNETPSVENVTGGYIYYTVHSRGIMNDNTDVVMMKVPISGGVSTVVGKWFVS